jgi:hypothetical protein
VSLNRAVDTRLERTVAIKVLPDHLSSSPQVRQRFDREAKTISQLSHAHICVVHDVGSVTVAGDVPCDDVRACGCPAIGAARITAAGHAHRRLLAT